MFYKNFNDKNGNFWSKQANIAIFENKKTKTKKIVNCTFIIHKTEIGQIYKLQPILESNSTSFVQ